MGSRRLLGRRVRNQAACRSSSGLSSGSESRDRIECRDLRRRCRTVGPPAGPTETAVARFSGERVLDYRGPTSSPTEKLTAPSALPAMRVAPVNVNHSGANASGTKEDLPDDGCQIRRLRLVRPAVTTSPAEAATATTS